MFKALITFLLLALVGFSQASIKISSITQKSDVVSPQSDLCKICVGFMDDSIEELIEIIANGGVIGSCGALCQQLPSQLAAIACDLICDYVGIDEFIKIINDVDPDPIYYCELFNVCPYNDNAAANITGLSVEPPRGPRGTTFNFELQFDVTNEIATGQLEVGVFPPDAEPFGEASLLNEVVPGSYQVQFSLQAQPSEDEPFSPGVYQVVFDICEGSCGSVHPHTMTLSQASINFTIGHDSTM